MNKIAGTGLTRRDASGQKDYKSHWNGLNDKQKEQVRSKLPKMPGFFVHTIENGIPDIQNSATFHFAAEGSKSPVFKQTTNVTHGFIHTLSKNASGSKPQSPDSKRVPKLSDKGTYKQNPTPLDKQDAKPMGIKNSAVKAKSKRAILGPGIDSFSFGNLNGIKLNYKHPCPNVQWPEFNDNTLVEVTQDFVNQFAKGRGSDHYNLELDITSLSSMVTSLSKKMASARISRAYTSGHKPSDPMTKISNSVCMIEYLSYHHGRSDLTAFCSTNGVLKKHLESAPDILSR